MITSLDHLEVSLELERARAREEKVVRDSSTKVSHYTKEVSRVKLGRRRDKLAQDMKRVRNVRVSDPKIEKAPN